VVIILLQITCNSTLYAECGHNFLSM
jgi:hypothetical protein